MATSIVFSPATTIITKIKKQQVTIVQVVTAFLDHIQQHNPSINAIYELRPRAEILAEAAEKDAELANGKATGALHGLPMTIKDSFGVKGLISSNGDPFLRKNRAIENATLITRLKEAGVIILGKTNIPLFCIDWQSTNWWNGQTNNPYHPAFVAGGSSGGAAAAVAAGMSPLEIGSDAGGSIRVPAHFCGICGLRPTDGALPMRGHLQYPKQPKGIKHITVAGPLAKNVADLKLLLRVLWQPTPSTQLEEEAPVALNHQTWDGKALKIAVANTINGIPVDEEYAAIFQQFVQQLAEQGHQIIQDAPVYDEAKAYQTCGEILAFEQQMNLPKLPLVSLGMYAFIFGKYRDHAWAKSMSVGVRLSATNYAKAIDQKRQVAAIYEAFFQQYDLWLTPVSPDAAFKHQRAGIPFQINQQKVPYTKAIASFTFTTALAGHPILVIPIGKKENGLPVGVQLHAKKWSDNRLLEIGAALEQLTQGFSIPSSFNS